MTLKLFTQLSLQLNVPDVETKPLRSADDVTTSGTAPGKCNLNAHGKIRNLTFTIFILNLNSTSIFFPQRMPGTTLAKA
jgi:hypothetical protein